MNPPPASGLENTQTSFSHYKDGSFPFQRSEKVIYLSIYIYGGVLVPLRTGPKGPDAGEPQGESDLKELSSRETKDRLSAHLLVRYFFM